MSVRIQIDQPQTHFTNLDFLTGKVVVHLVTDAAISAVTVKLEGESRTRLSGPKLGYNSSERPDKKRTELEWHKLLYRVETLFPNREAQQQAGNGSYILQAGHYEYPFRFKFPFNNDCQKNHMVRDLKVGGMGIAFNPDLNVKHVKRTLPPSLSGFPGEAEIKYYVKATVVRPKFYQENIRSRVDIKFLPIEPPRPPDRQQETFARRTQQFTRSFAEPEKKGLFGKDSTSTTVPEPPSFLVDARLPNPAIITCNDRLPLRILVQKLSASTETVYLSMLQIELIGYTHVRAHDLKRSESHSWVIMSKSNMNVPLGDNSDPVGKEWKIPPRYWENIPLPNTVAPSFDTCNISRTYELEVRVGLSHGGGIESIKPELMVYPLRLLVKVFSGIAPPPALLQRMATSHLHQSAGGMLQSPLIPSLNSPLYLPPTPMTPSYSQHPTPAPPGHFHPPHPPFSTIDDEDAPPSYEDAMADEIAPVDGPRRDYSVPTRPSADMREDGGFGTDSKGNSSGGGTSGISGLGRRVSERLFPQNGVGVGMGRRGHSDHGHSRQSSNEAEDGNGNGGVSGALGGAGRTQEQQHQQERGREPQPPPPWIVRKPTLPPSFEESTSTSTPMGTNNEGGGGTERR